MLRLWQELQEIAPDFDRRGSKNSFAPSSTMAGLATLAGAIGWMGSSRGAACADVNASRLTERARASIFMRLVLSFAHVRRERSRPMKPLKTPERLDLTQ